MHNIALDRPFELAAFRDAARGLVAAGIPPAEVIWHEGGAAGLFAAPDLPGGHAFPVPAGFVRLAEDVICHRNPGRLALLYHLLWRIVHGERALLRVAADPLVHQLGRMQKAVAREIHKMHAFVRFRRLGEDGGERFVAWFEPEHHILHRAAPFFVDRFSAMTWSILTPLGSLHWDGKMLAEGAAVAREAAPRNDDLEDWWRAYYRATFNPARANPDLMRAEMPKRYWKNLPEAALIPSLLAEAGGRSTAMLEAPPSLPRRRMRPVLSPSRAAAQAGSLAETAAEAAACRRCPLYARATQTVFGAGPPLSHGGTARIMMVGEQPGDQEDLAGQAFVGPAGKLLDQALAAAGIERDAVYVTNAVKHFKFEPRGKRRIHKKPERPEIEACRWWLNRELAAVRPEIVVALGGTAAQALTGRAVKVMNERGEVRDDPRGFKLIVTVHPSYLLRLPNPSAKQGAMEAFVADLALAAEAPPHVLGTGRRRSTSPPATINRSCESVE